MAKSFEYEVLREYGIISQNGAVSKRVRLVSFGDGPPRLDIRSWRQKEDGSEIMFKGVSLSGAELEQLKKIVRNLDIREG